MWVRINSRSTTTLLKSRPPFLRRLPTATWFSLLMQVIPLLPPPSRASSLQVFSSALMKNLKIPASRQDIILSSPAKTWILLLEFHSAVYMQALSMTVKRFLLPLQQLSLPKLLTEMSRFILQMAARSWLQRPWPLSILLLMPFLQMRSTPAKNSALPVPILTL